MPNVSVKLGQDERGTPVEERSFFVGVRHAFQDADSVCWHPNDAKTVTVAALTSISAGTVTITTDGAALVRRRKVLKLVRLLPTPLEQRGRRGWCGRRGEREGWRGGRKRREGNQKGGGGRKSGGQR